MNLTDDEAIHIYTAARSALYDAARRQTLDSPETATNLIAAAGREAFNASLKIARDQSSVFAVQVTLGQDRQIEYALSGDSMPAPNFGLMMADIVRHGAKAMRLDEEEVWQWVERERLHPTTGIKTLTQYAH